MGMDSANIFIITGFLLYKSHHDQSIDRWEFVRDDIFYLVASVLVCIFQSQPQIEWWMGFVLMIYFSLYLIVRRKDEEMKDKVLRLIGLIHDDDGFNVEANEKHTRQRIPLNHLYRPDDPNFTELISIDDPNLKKKILRAEAFVKLSETQSGRITSHNVHYWVKWHSITTMIIHGIKKRTEREKLDRAIKYKKELRSERKKERVRERDERDERTGRDDMSDDEERDDYSNSQESNLDSDNDEVEEKSEINKYNGQVEADTPRLNDEGNLKDEHQQLLPDQPIETNGEQTKGNDENLQHSNTSPQTSDGKRKEPGEEAVESNSSDDKSPMDNKVTSKSVINAQENNFENDSNESPEESLKHQSTGTANIRPLMTRDMGVSTGEPHKSLGSERRDSFTSSRAEPNIRHSTTQRINYDDENLDGDLNERDYNLSFPKDLRSRISYFIFFPINLILYFLVPNFRNENSGNLNRIGFALTTTVVILGCLSFLIFWWIEKLAYGVSAQSEMLGSCFASIGFTLPFMIHNFQEAEPDSYSSFRQIGIFRIGISIGISWLVGGAIDNSARETNGTGGVFVSYCILSGLLFIFSIMILAKKCVLPRNYFYPCFLFYGIWWISTFILNQFFAQF